MTRHFRTGLGVMFLSVVAAVDVCGGAEPIRALSLTTATEQVAPPVVTFSGGLLSVSAKNADIRALVESISAKSGVEIVLDKAIAGQVTIELKDRSFEEALKLALKDVVAGGFSSEFVKMSPQAGGLDIRKVVIAPKAPETAKDPSRVLRIDRITVQDAPGKEVVFAKRGNGPDEIPLPEREIEGYVYRGGFHQLRVGEDGSLYLFGGSPTHLFVFDAMGRQKAIPWPKGNYPFQDIDHEGNAYFMSNRAASRTNSVNVLMLGPEGKEIVKVAVPPQDTEFPLDLAIDDAARNRFRSTMTMQWQFLILTQG